jgi:carbon storage regulator CsrA
MLCLTRNVGDTVTVTVPGYPHPITVAVLEVRRGKCTLGFGAPREVAIKRDDMKKTPEPPPSYGRRAEGK